MTRVFDFLFWPFRNLHPLYAVTAFSAVTGVLMVLAFRYASNQDAVRRAKHRLGAHVMAVRLFQDQLGVVLRTYGKILRATGAYMGTTLKPLAVMVVPLVILIVQMDLRLGAQPAEPGKAILVKARFASEDGLERVELRLPDWLAQTAPALRIPEQREVDWRLTAARAGEYRVQVAVGDEVYDKLVVVSGALAALPGERRRGWSSWPLHPGEAPLPAGADVESLAVNYSPRGVSVAGWEMHWLIPFFVISLLVGYALKGVFRTEF